MLKKTPTILHAVSTHVNLHKASLSTSFANFVFIKTDYPAQTNSSDFSLPKFLTFREHFSPLRLVKSTISDNILRIKYFADKIIHYIKNIREPRTSKHNVEIIHSDLVVIVVDDHVKAKATDPLLDKEESENDEMNLVKVVQADQSLNFHSDVSNHKVDGEDLKKPDNEDMAPLSPDSMSLTSRKEMMQHVRAEATSGYDTGQPMESISDNESVTSLHSLTSMSTLSHSTSSGLGSCDPTKREDLREPPKKPELHKNRHLHDREATVEEERKGKRSDSAGSTGSGSNVNNNTNNFTVEVHINSPGLPVSANVRTSGPDGTDPPAGVLVQASQERGCSSEQAGSDIAESEQNEQKAYHTIPNIGGSTARDNGECLPHQESQATT